MMNLNRQMATNLNVKECMETYQRQKLMRKTSLSPGVEITVEEELVTETVNNKATNVNFSMNPLI